MPHHGQLPAGMRITAEITPAFAEILTPEALEFVARLSRAFEGTRQTLLQRRAERQITLGAGATPAFLPETAEIRNNDWTVAPIPPDLMDRRVEITGPSSDRKMVINALNSGAKIFMADFEDANTPNWENTIQGQINLRDAINRTIDYTSTVGKASELKDTPP